MAYMALYRKYRPQTFTDVVGQHQVSDTLMRAIREDKVAHAPSPAYAVFFPTLCVTLLFRRLDF